MTQIKIITAIILFLANLLISFAFFLPISILRIIPIKPVQIIVRKLLDVIVKTWIKINSAIIDLFTTTQWHVEQTERVNISSKGSYFMVSNHRSWVDIPVLQKLFVDKAPMLKFFLKQELIWVPILGYCWWALDFPFMKRYTKEFLAKHPEMKGKDFEKTKQACEKFKELPVSVINFLEGTRFTTEKHAKQQSQFEHLLRPKAGGIAFALTSMGPQIDAMIDVTLIYPQKNISMADLFANRIKDIIVIIDQYQIPAWVYEGDYINDENYRSQCQDWVNDLWEQKNQRITEKLAQINSQ